MLYLFWFLYFGIWAVSFLMMRPPKSKILFVLITLISIADIVYLAMHDLRTLLFVLLTTGFTIAGVGRAVVFGMRLQNTVDEHIE